MMRQTQTQRDADELPPHVSVGELDAIVDEVMSMPDTRFTVHETDGTVPEVPPEVLDTSVTDQLVEEELARQDGPIRAAEAQIREKVRSVRPTQTRSGIWRVQERQFGCLSTGEKIAVAMVLDRQDILRKCWGTMLEAVDRLGAEWTAAAHRVQRNGWGIKAS